MCLEACIPRATHRVYAPLFDEVSHVGRHDSRWPGLSTPVLELPMLHDRHVSLGRDGKASSQLSCELQGEGLSRLEAYRGSRNLVLQGYGQ